MAIEKLKQVFDELAKEYNFSCPCLEIVISKRMRSCNGRCDYNYHPSIGFKMAKITISNALLEECGWERMEKTFRHECAHIADICYRGKTEHDYHFKIICKKFGGSMPKRWAIGEFSECNPGISHKIIYKISYKCQCGNSISRVKRISKKVLKTQCCSSCQLPLSKWKISKII